MWKKTKILFDIWVWAMEDEQQNLKVKSEKKVKTNLQKVQNKLKWKQDWKWRKNV